MPITIPLSNTNNEKNLIQLRHKHIKEITHLKTKPQKINLLYKNFKK